jgi:hypothetical protein
MEELNIYYVLLTALSGVIAFLVNKAFPDLLLSRLKREEREQKQQELEQQHDQSMDEYRAHSTQEQLTLALNKAIGTDERLIAESSTANEFIRTDIISKFVWLEKKISILEVAVNQLGADQSDWMHELQQWQLERDVEIAKVFEALRADVVVLQNSIKWAERLLPMLGDFVHDKKEGQQK